ncbi:MAG: cupredoxin domain-containing protein [bacterium]|nr:cupredoxin domain-containing protein [bacterium]
MAHSKLSAEKERCKIQAMKFLSLVFLFVALPASAHTPEERTIHMTPDGFEPKTITVHAGDTVMFSNDDARERWPASNLHPTHTAYPGSTIEKCGTDEETDIFDACRNIVAGESYSFTFDTPGTWKYHDHLYAQHGGTIEVEGEGDAAATNEKDIFERFFDWVEKSWTRLYYYFFPSALEKRLENLSLIGTAVEDGAELRNLVALLGPSDYLRRIYEEGNATGQSCHSAAHILGRASFEVFGNNMFQRCSAECHSGCYHGATEAYFSTYGTQNLEKSLNTICNSDLNAFFSHQCLHGVGHGLMAWENYDLPGALTDCDTLSTGHESCYTGVFMENIAGGLAKAEGHFTQYLSEDPHYPCSIVDDKYRSSCYFLQTSRMIHLYNGDFSKIAAACKAAPEDMRPFCFQSMGRDAGGTLYNIAEPVVATCANATGSDYTDCLTGAIHNLLWDPTQEQETLLFCSSLTQRADKELCYRLMTERAPEVFALERGVDEFCTKIESDYQYLCKKQASR